MPAAFIMPSVAGISAAAAISILVIKVSLAAATVGRHGDVQRYKGAAGRVWGAQARVLMVLRAMRVLWVLLGAAGDAGGAGDAGVVAACKLAMHAGL